MGWYRRVVNTLLVRKTEKGIVRELSFHLEERVDELIATGMDDETARRTAKRQFGNLGLLRQRTRDVDLHSWIETIITDVRYGLRGLGRSPSFTLAVVTTLALGIGANIAVFSLVYGVLFRPLPYTDEERLVVLNQTSSQDASSFRELSPDDFLDIRNQNAVFESVVAAEPYTHNIGDGEPEVLQSWLVSPNFFQVLGSEALYGRVFFEEEHVPGSRVVVLSYGLWRRRFAGDPEVVGRTVTLRGELHTIVGVMPLEFQLPVGSDLRLRELWAPSSEPDRYRSERGRGYFPTIARIKDGFTIDDVQTNLGVIAARLAEDYPNSNTGRGLSATPLRDHLVGSIRPSLIAFLVATALVLLAVCANVVNLLLVRGSHRVRELAIRTALGAQRSRLFRQLMTENSVLAILSMFVGIGIAYGFLTVVLRLVPDSSLLLAGVAIDWAALLFAVVLCCAVILALGAAPIFHSSAIPREAIRVGEKTTSSAWHVQNSLVVGQIALAVALLVTAGLLTRSVWNLLQVDPGFRTERILSLQLDFFNYVAPQNRLAFIDEVIQNLRNLPGVSDAAAVSSLPMHENPIDIYGEVVVEGRPREPADSQRTVRHVIVTHGYFEAMGIPVVAGRQFVLNDTVDAPRVVLVNETMARQYWASEDPIGARVRLGYPLSFPGPAVAQIVGVVRDVRHLTLDTPPEPEVYVVHSQAQILGLMTFILRSPDDSNSLVQGLAQGSRNAIRSAQPAIPVGQVAPVEDFLWESWRPRRFALFLLGAFAGMGLLVAAVGLYGVIGYSVVCRQSEIGIRMALGGRRQQILGFFLRQGMTLWVLGALLGSLLAAAAARIVSSILFQVGPNDPATFVSVLLLTGIVSLLACVVPAYRAATLEPTACLRHE